MKNGNARCYAMELREGLNILIKITTKCTECQAVKWISDIQ